jgi:hypothetical protein
MNKVVHCSVCHFASRPQPRSTRLPVADLCSQNMAEILTLRENFVCSWLDVICRLSAICANQTFIIASLPVWFKTIFMVLLQFRHFIHHWKDWNASTWGLVGETSEFFFKSWGGRVWLKKKRLKIWDLRYITTCNLVATLCVLLQKWVKNNPTTVYCTVKLG